MSPACDHRRQREQRVGHPRQRADTTTTGCSARRASGRSPMSRRMAAASATDVPPNLATIIRRAVTASVHPAFGHQQLGDLDRLSRGAPDRVVAQQHEPEVEERAGPHPADRHRHPAAALEVEPGLRAVGRVSTSTGGVGRRGQAGDARVRAEVPQHRHAPPPASPAGGSRPRPSSCGRRSPATRLACALTAKSRRRDAVGAERAEDLPALPLDLLLFAADVRNHVAEDVERRRRRDSRRPRPPASWRRTASRSPKARCSGASASTSAAVEQFGLARMAPGQPRPSRWRSTSARWSALASGISSGTSASIRWFRVFVTTNAPAARERLLDRPRHVGVERREHDRAGERRRRTPAR